jgi:hypothetical protein
MTYDVANPGAGLGQAFDQQCYFQFHSNLLFIT